MDPNATLTELLAAQKLLTLGLMGGSREIVSGALVEIALYASELDLWVQGGGFLPTV